MPCPKCQRNHDSVLCPFPPASPSQSVPMSIVPSPSSSLSVRDPRTATTFSSLRLSEITQSEINFNSLIANPEVRNILEGYLPGFSATFGYRGDIVSRDLFAPSTYKPRLVICLPFNYSGDLIHIAAALAVSPPKEVGAAVEMDQTTLGRLEKSPMTLAIADNRYINAQIIQYLWDIGLSDRIIRVNRGSSSGQPNWSTSFNSCRNNASKNYGSSTAPEFGMTWSSTSIIMHYAKAYGRKKLIALLQARLTYGLSMQIKIMVDQLVFNFVKQFKQPIVLFMLRGSATKTDHQPHNTSKKVYDQVKAFVEKYGCAFCPIGSTTLDYVENPYDIFKVLDKFLDSDLKIRYPFGDKRILAYFWLSLARNPKVLGLIGGTSGSLDLAAMMGLMVLSWTQKGTESPWEEERLLGQLGLMSIIYKSGSWGDDTTLDSEVLGQWLAAVKSNCNSQCPLYQEELEYLRTLKSYISKMRIIKESSQSSYPWTLVDVAPDGDCFFNAILTSAKLQGIEIYNGSVDMLRKSMAFAYIDFLNEDGGKRRNILHLSKVELSVYNRILKGGEWDFAEFDWLVSVLAPRVLGRPIIIYRQSAFGQMSEIFCQSNSQRANAQKPLHLYLSANHYQGIKPPQ